MDHLIIPLISECSINISLIGSNKVLQSFMNRIRELSNSSHCSSHYASCIHKGPTLTINTNLARFKINLQLVPNKSKNIARYKKIFEKSNAIIVMHELENCTPIRNNDTDHKFKSNNENIIQVCDIAPSGASSSHIANQYVVIDTKNKINILAPLEEAIKSCSKNPELKITNRY